MNRVFTDVAGQLQPRVSGKKGKGENWIQNPESARAEVQSSADKHSYHGDGNLCVK